MISGSPPGGLHSDEGINLITKWHNDSAASINFIASTIFGKMRRNNWARASVCVIYENWGSIFISTIKTFPYSFTSGDVCTLPEFPDGDGDTPIHRLRNMFERFPPYFASSEFDEERKPFIKVLQPFILKNIDHFVSAHRSVEKIISAFGAHDDSGADINTAWNWFAESEQGIMVFLERHIEDLLSDLIPEDSHPIGIILNIVTLNNMCGMCHRTLELKNKLSYKSAELPLYRFVTGLRAYGKSRENLTVVAESITLNPETGLFVNYSGFGE